MASSEPLWKECADWLCRLQVLPDNHRILWPDATIKDLAYTLRDGVLLCHIATTLDNDSVDGRNVNQRPQMAQFLCLKNIRMFLAACRDSFLLKETDLFQPSMLYDYTDFARVLHTLSRLSNCDHSTSKRPDLSGFPRKPKAKQQQDEEDIYKTLEQLDEDKYQEFYYRHHGGAPIYYKQGSQQYYTAVDLEEDIYEDLCAFKNNVVKKQHQDQASRPRGTAVNLRRHLHNFVPKEKRDYCLKELAETEANYVEVLHMLKKNFMRALVGMKDTDKATVFMNISDLLEVHGIFYGDVLACIVNSKNDDGKGIGDIFVETKNKFLLYGDYCCQLPKAQETLDGLCAKDDCFKEAVASCEQAANEGRFRLRDLLAVPMQRVLKYHLLLRQLLLNTATTHEEYSTIKAAHDSMKDVADYINEVKRDSEQLSIIAEIQSSITDWHMPEGVELRDYGRLRKDSELKVQSHADQMTNKTKTRYVFVFDKVLLMCKAAGRSENHYTYKDSLKLADYKVQQEVVQTTCSSSTSSSSTGQNSSSTWAHGFMLVHVKNVNAYTLLARTSEDRNKWVTAIRGALDNGYPSQRQGSTHEAVMHSFPQPTTCDHCCMLLKGLFYQGYKCHKCSKALHKDCIGLLPKCGTAIQSSLPLPPSPLAAATNLVSRLSSCCSLDNNCNPDYINTRMEDHSWYVGNMDREAAQKRLMPFPLCSFLVRTRVNNNKTACYALSLKTTDSDVKHMKICQQDGNQVCYLSDSRKFKSVVELVSWYSRHSLKECFSGLDTTLRFPVGELILVQAQHAFSGNGNENGVEEKNTLPLHLGERVTVVDKSGDGHGWWKACNARNRLGYIPKDFVLVVADI